MTIRISVACDARDCCNEIELDVHGLYNEDEQIAAKGWQEDPNESSYHYCGKCWAVISTEDR